MRFSVLASGSKANCTFLEGGGVRVLLDCGLSAKQTEIRLRSIGIDPESIDAIVVSHEHHDHISGVSVMSRRYKLPVYVNQPTSTCLKNIYGDEHFETGRTFSIGQLKIDPFSIVHDAVDPVGFRVECEGLVFGQATDLGRVTPLVREKLADCQALLLEANHDLSLLRESDYPWELKQRISSSHGHLSNETAAMLLSDVGHSDLLHVVLGHLSENCNTPQAALAAMERYGDVDGLRNLVCAGASKATDLFDLGGDSWKQVSIA